MSASHSKRRLGADGRRHGPLAPKRRPALLLLAGLLLTGCADGTAPTAGNEPSPSPAQVLDFSAIAGEWVGEVTESVLDRFITYDATITLDAAAKRGIKIGTYDYGPAQDPIDPPGVASQDCGGVLFALEASGDDYSVEEALQHGQDRCRNGVIRLAHDEAANTLTYEWYTNAGELHANALLVRGE